VTEIDHADRVTNHLSDAGIIVSDAGIIVLEGTSTTIQVGGAELG
jgi:hypothetical protein